MKPSTTDTARRFDPGHAENRDLRRAFGRFGTGVTVVTTQSQSGPVGMTVNSFSSISLDPPLVMWSPALSSRKHDAFVAARYFCIHVLSSHQLKIAELFATDGQMFDACEWAKGPNDVPVLPGCRVELHCETFAIHPGGDHSVILGRVQHVVDHDTAAPGLMFEGGRFGSFAPFEDGGQ